MDRTRSSEADVMVEKGSGGGTAGVVPAILHGVAQLLPPPPPTSDAARRLTAAVRPSQDARRSGPPVVDRWEEGMADTERRRRVPRPRPEEECGIADGSSPAAAPRFPGRGSRARGADTDG